MAVLGSNTLNHSADLLIQRAGATRITVTSAGITVGGTLNGFTVEGASGNRWTNIPTVASNGVMEIGRYIDFHSTAGDTTDFTYRIDNTSNGNLSFSGNLNVSGTLNAGKTVFTKNAHASGADDFHLELFSSNINAANEVSLRMHQGSQFYGQIRLRSNGFHFTQGNNNNYRDIFFGDATASGTVTGPTFNATSTTSGGFQGIAADAVSTPSFTWTGDLTTGIYRATTSDVGITGGGVVRARFGGSILLYKNTFVFPVDDVAADGTTTTRASGTLNWRGKYWNGTSSINTDWNIIYVPTDTLGAGEFRIRNGTTIRLRVNNSGTVTATTFSGALDGNAATATTATNCSRQILSGNGMDFTGGQLNTDRTITLGTPSTITGSTTNSVTTSSHTHALTVNLGVTGGTTAGPIITSSAGTNATIPTASGTASGVVTTGNQTWAGTKTFNGEIRAFEDIADGTIVTRTRFGRDASQYAGFYGNSSRNVLMSVSTTTNPKNFQIRVAGDTTGTFTFGRDGILSATTFSGALSGNAATATTATNANKINRNSILASNTGSFRVLLGAASNNAGFQDCFVVTDASRLFYQPSSNTLTCGTFAGTATNCSRQILSGNGMDFTGGQLNTDRTITLGTPSTITGSTTNSVTTSSHTHALTVNLGVTGGTTAGPIITSSAGTNATIPTASGTASGVVTTGDQTWAGTKTFSSTISGSINGNAATATTATNANKINRNSILASNTGSFRVLLGAASNNSGFQDCFVVTDASRLLYRPDTDTLTCGTFAGTATNCSREIINGNGMDFTGGQLNTNRTITLGTPSTITGSTTNSVTTSSHTHALTVNLGVTGGTTAGPIITSSAGTNATIPTASGTASGVVTTGNQTWAGTKTFSSRIIVSNTFNVNGSGPGGQADGLYIADLGSTVGTTLNPTFTVAIAAQISSARSIALSVDGSGYLWGMRSHSNAETYTFQSKTKFSDQSTTATNCSRQILSGNGMNFTGGQLNTDRTITLGTPGDLTGTSTSAVTTNSHTHKITVNLGVTNGTTGGPTITSSAGTNATIPTATGTVSGVVTTGNQTWAGTKTFTTTQVLTTAADAAADGTTTLRNSSQLTLRGKYWNGTSSVNTDWNIIYVPTNTSGAGDFRIRNGSTNRLTVNNSGTVTATTFSGALDGNAATATTATNCSRQILSGNGMDFTGGQLNTDRTITLGTPSTITGSTTNSVTTSSHTHALTVNLGVTGGTTAGPIITSSAGTNATIPTASGTASGVVTTGDQTWAGTKTFSSTISGSINGNAATATNCSRQILSGNGMNFTGGQLNTDRTITLGTPGDLTGTTTSAVTASSHTHKITVNLGVTNGTTGGPTITSSAGTNATIPTATGTVSGVVTTGNQTWAGTKTFNNDIISVLGAKIISGSAVTIGLSGETVGSTTNPSIQANGVGTNTGAILVSSYSSTDSGPQFVMMKSRSGTVGTLSRALLDDFLGRLRWRAASTTSTIEEGARISVRADGNWTSTSCPTRMQFSLCASGSTSASVRFQLFANRVKTAQRLDANTDSTPFTSTNSIFSGTGAGSNTGNVALETWGTSTATRFHISFSNPNGVVGSISTNGTTTAFNTTSDYRLKENILPLENALERIRQLSVYRFNFIGEPNKIVDGFLAHEVKNIIPESISGEKDEIVDIGKIVASDGTIIKENVNEPDSEELLVDNYEWIKTGESPVYQGIDQSKIVPLLTAALQEAIEKIETLEVRVSQLEAS
jgi:hypothetical protein